MKTGKLLLMVLVLLLGTAVAAPAVTIHSPWGTGHHEENLYQIMAPGAFPSIITLSGTPLPWKACRRARIRLTTMP